MLKNCSTKIKIKFLRYEQSSQCKSARDSSVSYASAAAKVDAWICKALTIISKQVHAVRETASVFPGEQAM